MRVSQWMHGGCLVTVVALTAACNSILGVDDVTPESTGSSPSIDAGVDARQCDVMPDFTLVAATPSTSALSHHMNGAGASLLFLLNNDSKPDALALDLYDNMGGHATVNAVGSYNLSTSDAVLASCGLCVGVYTNFDSSANTFSQTYFAAAQGTLKLTMFDATGISGSLKGLKFRQVDLSGGATQDIVGGCTVTVEDAEFTAKWSTAAASATTALRMIPSAAPSRAGL